jgi:hypothetical protein
MKEVEALMEIQNMSIGEKIAALSQTDKAYIRGYVERAIIESRRIKRKNRAKKTAEQKGYE